VLDRRGLVPVSVEERAGQSRGGWTPQWRRITPQQVTRLLADLSVMLNAGIRIDEALSIMEKEFDNGGLQPVIGRLHSEIANGRSFSQALEDWPALFPAFQVAMVRVAETSGNLPQLLGRIVEERQRFEQLSTRTGEALRYPAVLLLGTLAVLVFFLVGVLPQFSAMTLQMGDAGGFLGAMFALSDFLRNNADIIMGASLALLVALLLAMRRRALRDALWARLLQLPGVSEIARSYRTARFTRLLGIMVETGITAPTAIRLISDTVDLGARARDRAQEASDAVRQGQRLTAALELLRLPPLAIRMLRIGEQSGELAALSYKVADFYEARLERSLARLVGFIGPAAVIFISILIGGMIVSIMSTLMSFNELIG
jgi:general secretion pathway protein F